MIQPLAQGFSGQHLQLTASEDEKLRLAFRELTGAMRHQHYRDADFWLVTHPERKIKKHMRFAGNWIQIELHGHRSRRSGRTLDRQAQILADIS